MQIERKPVALTHFHNRRQWPGPSVPKGETGHTTGLRPKHLYPHCTLTWRRASKGILRCVSISTVEPTRSAQPLHNIDRERGELGCTDFFYLQ